MRAAGTVSCVFPRCEGALEVRLGTLEGWGGEGQSGPRRRKRPGHAGDRGVKSSIKRKSRAGQMSRTAVLLAVVNCELRIVSNETEAVPDGRLQPVAFQFTIENSQFHIYQFRRQTSWMSREPSAPVTR